MFDYHLLNGDDDVGEGEVQNESVVAALGVFSEDEVRDEDKEGSKKREK